MVLEMKYEEWDLSHSYFFLTIQVWVENLKGQGIDKMYGSIIAQDTSVHTLQVVLPIASCCCFAYLLKLCYSSHDCSVWKSIIPDSLYQLYVAFYGISPMENGYFDIWMLFKLGHILPAL